MAVSEGCFFFEDGSVLTKGCDLLCACLIGVKVLWNMVFPESIDGIKLVIVVEVELFTNFGLFESVRLVFIAIVGHISLQLFSSKCMEF